MTTNQIVGSTFTLAHGGGTTTYRIEGKHRDPGFFDCVAIFDGPENSHRFKGTLQVVSREDIIAAQRAEHPTDSLCWGTPIVTGPAGSGK